MFKMIKRLLIALGIIFFLFCTMVLLIRIDVISLPTDSGTKVYNFEAEELEQIQISNEYGDYTLIVNSPEEVLLKGEEDRPHDPEVIGGIVETCRKVYAYDVIEENSIDLSVYGLSEPQMSATIVAGDEVHTLYIGDMMPNNNSYYVSLDNDNTVYAVIDDYLYYYKQEPYKYLSKQLNLLTEAETEYMIDNFSLKREGEPVFEFSSFPEEEKKFYNITNLYKITFPYTAVAKDANIVEYLNSIVNLKCARIIALDITEEDLKEVGLDNPYYEITYTYYDEDYRIRISEPENGVSYIYIDGDDVIYNFVAQKIYLLTFDIFNLVNPTQFTREITYIERVVIDIDGTEYVYGVTESNGSISQVTMNNQKVDVEQFKTLYSILVNSRIDGVSEEVAKEDPYLSFTFKYYTASGYNNDVVSFHEINSRQYLMKINGEGSFYVSSVYLDKIVDSVAALNAGQTFDASW